MKHAPESDPKLAPRCLDCSRPVRWLSTAVGAGWSLFGEQRFTCKRRPSPTGNTLQAHPHYVATPPLRDQAELERWLDG